MNIQKSKKSKTKEFAIEKVVQNNTIQRHVIYVHDLNSFVDLGKSTHTLAQELMKACMFMNKRAKQTPHSTSMIKMSECPYQNDSPKCSEELHVHDL